MMEGHYCAATFVALLTGMVVASVLELPVAAAAFALLLLSVLQCWQLQWQCPSAEDGVELVLPWAKSLSPMV